MKKKRFHVSLLSLISPFPRFPLYLNLYYGPFFWGGEGVLNLKLNIYIPGRNRSLSIHQPHILDVKISYSYLHALLMSCSIKLIFVALINCMIQNFVYASKALLRSNMCNLIQLKVAVFLLCIVFVFRLLSYLNKVFL